MAYDGDQIFLSYTYNYVILLIIEPQRCRMYLKFCYREYDPITELYDRSISRLFRTRV